MPAEGNESSYEDSAVIEDKLMEQTKQHLMPILRSNPQGCSLRQLHESLKVTALGYGPKLMSEL